MYLTDITFRDFGVDLFQDARMESIEDGLVVIGGPQRAGKTTFLNAIRRLGYGIERNPDLPPAVDEYNLQATLTHEGHDYVLKLEGHSDPSLVGTGGAPAVAVADVFGGVSENQYQQLYTITLDELERIPETIDTEEALTEVLLGAAYGDVAVIPDVEETFQDRAYEIGRSYGKPTKKSELNAPIQTIETGIERRDEANRQVDEWGETKDELAAKQAEIDDLQDEIETLENEAERLAVLEDEYDALLECQQLRETLADADLEAADSLPDDAVGRAERLQDDYSDVRTRYDERVGELQVQAPDQDAAAYKTALLEHESDLNRFDKQVAKWRTQAEEIASTEEDLVERRAALERRVPEIHGEWEGRFEPVLDVQTDALAAGDVAAAVEDFQKAEEDLETAKQNRQEADTRLAELQAQLDEQPDTDSGDGVDRSLLGGTVAVGLLAVALGVGGAIGGAPGIGGLAAVVALLVGLYLVVSRSGSDAAAVSTARELKAQIQTVEADKKTATATIEEATERRDEAVETLQDIKKTLGLPQDVAPESVEPFYEDVVECKEAIRELKEAESQLEADREALVEELSAASDTVSTVRSHHWDPSAPVETAEHLFEAIETAAEDLELAQELRSTERELGSLESDIEALIADWPVVDDLDAETAPRDTIAARLEEFHDAAAEAATTKERQAQLETQQERLEDKLQTGSTKAAFNEIRASDESWLSAFEEFAVEYEDAATVTEELQRVEAELEELNATLEEATETRVELRNRLDELHSDDDIFAARQQISEGREDLRALGEDYAVNRIAEHLTERLHRRFIEEVAGPLMDDASEIFHRITRDYDGITHNEQFDDLDFDALRDGKPPQGSDELSRATAEQLFLAVRLARIRQLDVSLPVVIDDSLTNFDPAHGARTFQTIAELGETNQVFFLTCHPEYVALADTHAEVSQFWCLDDGRFTGPHDNGDPLYELLDTDTDQQLYVE